MASQHRRKHLRTRPFVAFRPFKCPRPRRRGFTLIEILVVVAIIALLISILIPSLQRARELARITKCLANQSNLPKAVHVFATEHKGFAQLIGTGPSGGTPGEWGALDPTRAKYDYQANMFGSTIPMLKPWPQAYARALGETGFVRAEQYFTTDSAQKYNKDFFFNKFGKKEVFLCPSDPSPIHNMWSPQYMLGMVSYAANEDVFGVSEPPEAYSGTGGDWEGQPWAEGTSGDTNPPRAKRLEGRLDRIVDPSTVALFCDGGREDSRSDEPCLLITNGSGMNGPYIENYERYWGRLPHFRHLSKGAITAVLADGSGKLSKAARFTNAQSTGGLSYVERYAPRIRVSPYKVGSIKGSQP